jgi:tRNA(Ile)-lysidine synthase
MASSRKPRSDRRIAVALSGGVDSVVLLHQLKDRHAVSAIHVHHGLSPNADAWADFCRKLCKRWGVPLTIKKVKVVKRGEGLEAAARKARYDAFSKIEAHCVALAHNLDDQAETVLMNLLRGAGTRGARGMLARSSFNGKALLRPLLGVSRDEILAYARKHSLEWIEDESNADEALTRNFIRRRIAPLLAQRFPQWKRSLGRAAQLFSKKEIGREEMLRAYLRSKGLKAPSEAKLAEMLKQLAAGGPRTRIEHDGSTLRLYRSKVLITREDKMPPFAPVRWRGERRLALPALAGELRFKRGPGIAAKRLKSNAFEVRLRSGGERLQPDPRRPRRTLKNLFQEAGVPHWTRGQIPLLFCGDDLVWVPGVGVDARYQGRGLVPEWHRVNLP